MYVNVRLNADG